MDRETIAARTKAIMKHHVGKSNAISANRLFMEVMQSHIVPARAANQTRIIRSVVRDLRKTKALPVLSGKNGYWLAETDQELHEFSNKLLRTAVRQFGLAHELSGIPIDRMIEQFQLDLSNTQTDTEKNEVNHVN